MNIRRNIELAAAVATALLSIAGGFFSVIAPPVDAGGTVFAAGLASVVLMVSYFHIRSRPPRRRSPRRGSPLLTTLTVSTVYFVAYFVLVQNCAFVRGLFYTSEVRQMIENGYINPSGISCEELVHNYGRGLLTNIWTGWSIVLANVLLLLLYVGFVGTVGTLLMRLAREPKWESDE